MLKNSVLLALLILAGCSHKKGDFFLATPQENPAPRITPVIIERSKSQMTDASSETERQVHSEVGVGSDALPHAEVEIQASEPMEHREVEVRPVMKDAEIQTDEPIVGKGGEIDIDDMEDIESILLEEEQQEQGEIPKKWSDYTIHQSEYFEEENERLQSLDITTPEESIDSNLTLESEDL